MPGRLEGARIVVTRPGARRDELARRLGEEGARVLPFPALHIQPLADTPPTGPFQGILFTSPTAVRCGLPGLPKPLPKLCLAPGQGTRSALAEGGIKAAFAPRGGAGLTPLLAELPGDRLAGLSLMVVTGRPVNEAGLRRLAEHGAKVKVFAAYARQPARTAGPLARWLESGSVDVIMASSTAAVRTMHRLPGIDLRQSAWLVSSERVANAVRNAGSRVVARAASAEAAAMTTAACRWWRPNH